MTIKIDFSVIELRDPGRLKVLEKAYKEGEEFMSIYANN